MLAACSIGLPSQACVLLFDRPPGVKTEERPGGGKVDACTDHYGATIADVGLGTLSLAGGVFAFGLSSISECDACGSVFGVVGVLAVANAVVQYISAASNDFSACQRAKADTR